MLPACGGILLMLWAIESGRLKSFFGSGLLLGLAFAVKQHGLFFIAFAGTYLLLSRFQGLRDLRMDWRRYLSGCALFLFGAVLPFGVSCIYFLHMGLFEKFWFWSFQYTKEYTSMIPFFAGLYFLKMNLSGMAKAMTPMWVLAGVGLAAFAWDIRARRQVLFMVSFALFSFLAICPGYRFFPHYFALALPSVAILVGIGVSSTVSLLAECRPIIVRRGVPVLLTAMVLYPIYIERAYLFKLSPNGVSRAAYGPAFPFPESVEIANYIKEHTSKNDCIAVIGSEPQIYFYSQRRSASAHIVAYPWAANHKYAKQMQREVKKEIESARPKFLIIVNFDTSWSPNPAELTIFEWLNRYETENYRLAGIIEVFDYQRTAYRWGPECEGHKPLSHDWILVLERKA
jgi:hypothetical protein